LPPTSGGYPPPQPNPFAHDDWSKPAPPPDTISAPESFHNLYLAHVILYVLGFIAAVIWVVALIASIETNNQETFSRTRASMNDEYDPFGRPSTNSYSAPEPEPNLGVLFGGIAILLVIFLASYACELMILYKAWDLIQDGRARTTPGMAAGLMLVPIFYLGWQFVAVRGLAEDLNSYTLRHNYQVREANVGIVTASLVLQLCGLIPYVGGCPQLIGVVLHFVALYSIKNTAADIASTKLGLI
jgi:hypothetical protein